MNPNQRLAGNAHDDPALSANPQAQPSQGIASGVRRILAYVAPFLLLTNAGCVSNHSFPGDAGLDVPRLVSELEAIPKNEDALFDLTYLPLLHLDLQTFGKKDESSSYPAGHEAFSIRSWLPLFLIVDADIEFFDTDDAAYERSEFMAVLWGLWARSEMTVQTQHGERIARKARLLWFLDWEDSVEYKQR